MFQISGIIVDKSGRDYSGNMDNAHGLKTERIIIFVDRDSIAIQRIWTPPDIGIRELLGIVRGQKKGPRESIRKNTMQDINPQDGFPNPDFPTATSDDVEAARQSVLNAFNDVAQIFADRGVMKNLAVMFQADPLFAEIAFRGDFLQLGRTILSGALESFDYGPFVEVEVPVSSPKCDTRPSSQ